MPTVPRRRRSPEEVLAAAPVPGPKKVLLAAPRGYCAGVDRAVIAVEKALQHYGPPVYVRKQIVHNVHVVSSLEEQGAIFVDETDEVPEGALVIFSAHGVSPAVVQSAEDRGLRTIDATCPLVTKVHKEAVRFAKDDFDILLIGHDGHEEVEGTAGEAPDHIQIINGPHEVDKVTVRDPEKVIWLSQTTLSVDETMETVRLLKDRFPTLQDPPSDDICYATTNRQVAIKKIAPQADLVIVVGSATPPTPSASSKWHSNTAPRRRTVLTSPTRWTSPGSRVLPPWASPQARPFRRFWSRTSSASWRTTATTPSRRL
jgi:4-hydroxy-3-methylbut-2-enyl diphosphate reductase